VIGFPHGAPGQRASVVRPRAGGRGRHGLAFHLAVWTDASLLHFRAAHLLVRATLALYRAHLIPRAALPAVHRLAARLADRGARLRIRRLWR
jgi:hypothetical protein